MSKKIDEALKELNKEFGEGSILRIKEKDMLDIEAIGTNCLTLDYVLACGGMPRGRIMEVYGQESSGKSTLCLHLVSEMQKTGGKCVWIDAECSYSKKYAENIGVNNDELILSQPTTGEEGLKMLRKMVETNEIDLIIVDSVAALVPQKELAGELFDAEMAQQARMMSKSLRVLAGTISKTKTVVIFINQLRDKIGIYWGAKHSTPGGKALKFYSSVRIEVKAGKKIEDSNKDIIGNWLKIKAVKNKVGMPFREGEFELIYSKGIDTYGDLLDFAVKKGVIKRAGASYTFGEEKLGLGRDAAKKYLAEKKDIKNKIRKLCL